MIGEVIYGKDLLFIEWAEAITRCRFRDDAVAIGVMRGDRPAAAVVYDTFSTSSCMVHLASDRSRRWLTREFLFAAFAYPFLQCRYPRISSLVSELNADSLRVTRHFGWVEEGRLRADGENGEDMILFGMLRSECRFLPPPNPFAGQS